MLVQQEAGVSYNQRSTEAIPHSTAFVVLCRHLDGIIFTSLRLTSPALYQNQQKIVHISCCTLFSFWDRFWLVDASVCSIYLACDLKQSKQANTICENFEATRVCSLFMLLWSFTVCKHFIVRCPHHVYFLLHVSVHEDLTVNTQGSQ